MGPFRLLVSETRASRRLEGKRIRMSFALVATASILASVARAGPGWQCNGPDYIALPAATKLDQIWENCAADQTSAPWLSMLEVGEIMFESMCPTFNTEGDQLPLGWTGNVRQKYIHSVGTVGKVEWVDMGGHPYTGIFQGASQGIAKALSCPGAKPSCPQHCTWHGPQVPQGRGGRCQHGGHVRRRWPGVLELLRKHIHCPHPGCHRAASLPWSKVLHRDK